MTAEERNQIAALTSEVAGLKATVTNEFKHVTDRLDSHSQQIKGLAADMGEVKQHIAVSQAVNGYRKEYEQYETAQQARFEDRQAEDARQKRGKLYDAGLLVLGALAAGGVGWLFDWLRGFVSCKPTP